MPELLKKSAGPFLPVMNLQGFRVDVRPPQPDDGPSWAETRERNRLFLKPYEPTWPPETVSAVHFERRLERQTAEWSLGRAQPFLIFLKDGTLIGGININNISRGAAQFASLGYWLDQAQQGHGYMAEALHLIIHYAFTDLTLHRLNAGCLSHNERSKILLQKAGFREEGYAEKYLEINGQWQDHILFGLPVEQWKGAF